MVRNQYLISVNKESVINNFDFKRDFTRLDVIGKWYQDIAFSKTVERVYCGLNGSKRYKINKGTTYTIAVNSQTLQGIYNVILNREYIFGEDERYIEMNDEQYYQTVSDRYLTKLANAIALLNKGQIIYYQQYGE